MSLDFTDDQSTLVQVMAFLFKYGYIDSSELAHKIYLPILQRYLIGTFLTRTWQVTPLARFHI